MTTAICHDDTVLSALDKSLINMLQHGLPITERPFLDVAIELNVSEEEVIARVNNLMERKVLTRFGPMFDAACLGGAFTLAALSVPDGEFERVTEQVNRFEQVAHNYRRNHQYNMWFVIATESQCEINDVIKQIEDITGYVVLNVPKLEEFYVGLYLSV